MQRIHVMAAVLMDANKRILIAQRPLTAHQGGLWEFPGGKRESGESREQALVRELTEELGIHVLDAQPLICIAHDYPDRRVLLDVWQVNRWRGEVSPCEGQPLEWVDLDSLQEFAFPAADLPVLEALRLPQRYLITAPPGPHRSAWMADLKASLSADTTLVQIRAPNLNLREFESLAHEAVATVRGCSREIRILLNADPDLAQKCGADGVHFNHQRLWAQGLSKSPSQDLAKGMLLGVSCHQGADLHQALAIGANFAVLGPVAATRSHPGAPVLGWQGFAALLEEAALPVYALGGMVESDLASAIAAGAQGIAGIRAFWNGPSP